MIQVNGRAPLDGPVAWSPTIISRSNVRFSNMRIKTGAGAFQRLTFILPNTGAGVVTGSYAPASNLVLRVNPAQNYPALFTASGSAAGVPSVTIGPGPSTGTW